VSGARFRSRLQPEPATGCIRELSNCRGPVNRDRRGVSRIELRPGLLLRVDEIDRRIRRHPGGSRSRVFTLTPNIPQILVHSDRSASA
jgi:hypothetical protein